ncbi:MAG: Ldh family oxidoreductase [Propionibacteriaceae bacterium]
MQTDVVTAQRLAEDLLIRAGVTPDGAAQQAELLLVAEAKGVRSHGLLRLPRLLRRLSSGVAHPTTTGDYTWRSPTYLAVDGQQGLGPVVALAALDAVAPAAFQYGIACAAITNNNHLGMLSWYSERMAERGLVCIATTTSEALVHPYGGTEAMVGTNPLSIGVPAQPWPLVLDMATSQVSMGRIHDHALRGLPLEPGWALDADGRPTVDAEAGKLGSVAPFGGAKGYALGLSLGALISSVTGAPAGTAVHGTLDDTEPSSKGDLFILIAGAGQPVSGYLDDVRASRAADPRRPVQVPGDGAHARLLASQSAGIEVPDHLWAELTEAHETQAAR